MVKFSCTEEGILLTVPQNEREILLFMALPEKANSFYFKNNTTQAPAVGCFFFSTSSVKLFYHLPR